MKKYIKTIVESLFDDNVLIDTLSVDKMTYTFIKNDILNWLHENLYYIDTNITVANKDKYDNLHDSEMNHVKLIENKNIFFDLNDRTVSIKLKDKKLKIINNIPDFIKINLLECNFLNVDGLTNLYNLPANINGDLWISRYNNKELLFDNHIVCDTIIITDCDLLLSLKNMNNYITFNNLDKIKEKSVWIENCNDFISTKGICKNITILLIIDCFNFTSLEDLPKKMKKLYIDNCTSFISLDKLTAINYIKELSIYKCRNLNILNLPKKVDRVLCNYSGIAHLDCNNTTVKYLNLNYNSLTTLKNGPKYIEKNYYIINNRLRKLEAFDTTLGNNCNLSILKNPTLCNKIKKLGTLPENERPLGHYTCEVFNNLILNI